jgi:hypothetical protein
MEMISNLKKNQPWPYTEINQTCSKEAEAVMVARGDVMLEEESLLPFCWQVLPFASIIPTLN